MVRYKVLLLTVMEPQTSIRIAYAEEQLLVRKGIISLLSIAYDLMFDIEAADGSELLEKLSGAGQLPDICIIAIRMAPMDGHTTLVELRKRWPDLKVLVLTENTNPKIMMRMIAAGANGYVQKKSSSDIIISALRGIHENGYYYSNEATMRIFKQIKANAIKAARFSPPELAVIRNACSNLSYEAIGRKIGASGKSVEGYRIKIYKKLEISNRAELALFAFQSGLTNREEDNENIT